MQCTNYTYWLLINKSNNLLTPAGKLSVIQNIALTHVGHSCSFSGVRPNQERYEEIILLQSDQNTYLLGLTFLRNTFLAYICLKVLYTYRSRSVWYMYLQNTQNVV